MKKWILFVTSLLLISTNLVFAQEVIPDFEKDSVPILNEELRKARNDITNISGDAKRVLMWYISGEQETGTDVSAYLVVPFSGTIITAQAHVKTNPTGADLIIDINKNGTTLWASGKLTISATATDGSKTTFDNTTVSVDDYFTVDIDQIGSTLPGENLTVLLYIQETLKSRL